MRGTRLVTSAMTVLALILGAAPLAAGNLSSAPVDQEKKAKPNEGDRLEAMAMDLLDMGDTELWEQAAELLEKAARARPESDPKRVSNLRTAGNIYYWDGATEHARVLFEEAALTASHLGRPALAAHIYVDAAVLSAELRMGRHTIAAARQAELLAASPVLSSEERAAIQSRLDRLNAPRRLSEIM